MKVCIITCTKNRHSQLERSVRFFLEQDYSNAVQLIYNNSCNELILSEIVPKDKIILVNNCIDSSTGEKYTNLGAIYNDAIKYIPEDAEIVSFFDDDDIFLKYHISEGVKGYKRALEKGMIAYKPKKSYFRNGNRTSMVENTLEPSIFVKKDHVLKYGFFLETSPQHLKWVDPLVYEGKIFADPKGTPTLIYNWGDEIKTFKTSGNPTDPNNFLNYEKFSQDKGDSIITPWSKQEVSKYYKL